MTAGVFSVLALVRSCASFCCAGAPWLQVVLRLAAAGLLLATAERGGELVFRHGMGVVPGQ